MGLEVVELCIRQGHLHTALTPGMAVITKVEATKNLKASASTFPFIFHMHLEHLVWLVILQYFKCVCVSTVA